MTSTSFSAQGRTADGINAAEVGNLLGYRKTIARVAATNEIFASLVAPKFGVKVPPVVVLGIEWDRVTIMSVGINGQSFAQYEQEERRQGRSLPAAKRNADTYLSNYAPKLVEFDRAIGNTDRHGGNFIIGDDREVWGIDHEFLGGERYRLAKETYAAEWEVACSLTGHKPKAVEFRPMVAEVRKRAANGAIEGCQCGCANWTPAPEDLVSAKMPEEPMGNLGPSVRSWVSPVESYPEREPYREPVWADAARCSLGCCPVD